MERITQRLRIFPVLLSVLLALALAAAPAQAAKSKTPKVDLNSASQQELEALPGVGEATAKKIIAGRPYASVDDLSKAGVSASTISKLKSKVTVGGRRGQLDRVLRRVAARLDVDEVHEGDRFDEGDRLDGDGFDRSLHLLAPRAHRRQHGVAAGARGAPRHRRRLGQEDHRGPALLEPLRPHARRRLDLQLEEGLARI